MPRSGRGRLTVSSSNPPGRRQYVPWTSHVSPNTEESEPYLSYEIVHPPYDVTLDVTDIDRSGSLDDLNPNPTQHGAPSRETSGTYDVLPPQSPEDPLHNSNPLLSLDELLDESSAMEVMPTDPTRRTLPRLGMLRPPRDPRQDEERARMLQDERTIRHRMRQDAIRAQFPGLESATTRREAHAGTGRSSETLERLIGELGGDTDDDEDEDDDTGSEPNTYVPAEFNAEEHGTIPLFDSSSEDLAVLGGSGARVTLRRGTYNRNRRSIMERIRARDAESPADGIVVSTEVVRRSGLRPTNSQRPNDPQVIRTAPRKNKSGTISPSRLMKRRKGNEYPDAKPPLSPVRPTYLLYTTLPATTPLPDTFTPPSRLSRVSLSWHQSATASLRPCVTFTYSPLPHGPNDDDYASSLRSNIPIPVDCGVHYYEAEVLDAGESGYMSVGWMKGHVCLDRLVGWDKGSWGWHGDDGRSFEGRGEGEVFGEGWGKGDVVGCGIDFIMKKAFFTKNGRFIGYRFKDLGEGLHPAIGLRTPQESLAVNFTGPFKYDIDNYIRNVRDTTWRSAITPAIPQSPTIPPRDASKAKKAKKDPVLDTVPTLDIDKSVPSILGDHSDGELDLPPQSTLQDSAEKTPAAFVLDYLRHEGHEKALRSVQSSMRSRGWTKPLVQGPEIKEAEYDENSALEDFSSTEACLAWIAKRVSRADTLSLPMTLLESLLSEDELSSVAIHHYLFLVRSANTARNDAFGCASAITEPAQQADTTNKAEKADSSDDSVGADEADEADLRALAFGQRMRRMSQTWTESERRRMKEAFGLISVDQAQWREDGVGGRAAREKDADDVVGVIRRKLGLKPNSYLAQAFAQTTASLRLLAPRDPSAAFIDPSRILTDTGCLGSRSTRIKGVKVERADEEEGPVVVDGEQFDKHDEGQGMAINDEA